MKILCAFGRHAYGRPERGASYENANFTPALRALGHEVEVFDSFDRSACADFGELNRRFLERVERFRPDVIFCVLMGYELWQETLALARTASGACLINWATDDSWKYDEFSRLVAPAFDIYATTYRSAVTRAVHDGLGNFLLTQWAAPGSLLRYPKPAVECRYPVSFIGAAYGNRRKWIAELSRHGIAVACFGHGWDAGTVRADEIPQIINDSVVSLNFGDSGLIIQGGRITRSRQIKARVFEIPAAGGYLMTEMADNIEEYFTPGEEIETFDGINDLVAKLRRLLDDPDRRDVMASAGHHRARGQHTYEMRFSQLFAHALRPPAVAMDERRHRVDWAAFEKLERSHEIGPMLKALRAMLSWPCILLFGHQRGRRAARRLLFETSWRVAGRFTYTARGWPGRLYYRES